MKPICRELQERLASEGAQALRADAAAQRHLEECTQCFRVLEELARLDETLGAMSALDAPERVVQELLVLVKDQRVGTRSPVRRPSLPRPLLWGLATAASVVFAASVLLMSARRLSPRPTPKLEAIVSDNLSVMPPAGADKRADVTTGDRSVAIDGNSLAKNGAFAHKLQPLTQEESEKLRALGYLGDDTAANVAARKGETSRGKEGQVVSSGSPDLKAEFDVYRDPSRSGTVKPGAPSDEAPARANELGRVEKKAGEKDARKERGEADLDEGRAVGGGVAGRPPVRVGGALNAPKQIRHVAPVYPQEARRAQVQGTVTLEVEIDARGQVSRARVLRSIPLLDAAAVAAVLQWRYAPTLLNGGPVPVIMTVTVNFRLPSPSQEKPGASENPSTEPARAFLDERTAIEGISFQPARGYWANTYVPGDPALRLLRSRLLAWDRSPLQAQAGFPLRLHDDAVPPSQPFDPPRSAGLAVYIHADRGGLDKPSRMLLQVGLKGSPRSGASRPAMTLALVLDLRGNVPAETAADMRALALAFSEARQVGDRFSLILAGRPGGVAVGPDRFKHGPLAVALDQVLAGDPLAAGQTLSLTDALAAAFGEASHRDDPDAALGSSAVILVTGQPPGEPADVLADLAHQGAVAGIPLSVVGVGSGAPLAELDRLALTGQGSRRLLEARSDAARLVEAELTAGSDAVARAVRLRIRLAAGVRLVGIVGSRRLDEAQAQRVREAERSIDLRLSRNLGIESDRGEDEDGIQVVIPLFHASDAHVILLDVVAQAPGALADVSVRYKDLVLLRNGVARASLSLPAGTPSAGPLERNVLKNLLAFRLAQTLAAAGSALDAGDAAEAVRLVEEARALRRGLLARAPGLTGDPELARDVAMLEEYARLLGAGPAIQPQLAAIADSLRYVGRLKLSPRPAPLGASAL